MPGLNDRSIKCATEYEQAVLAKWEARRERYIKIEKRSLPQVKD